jgi:SAM-dependent methyltransferase
MTSDERQKIYWEEGHKFRAYDHPVVQFFARQRIDQIREWLARANIRTALDVGCGDGFSSFYMREAIGGICATDRSNRMLARHPFKHEGRVACSDATRLPYPDQSFDLVYCWELLHHVSDPAAVLAEMTRVSRTYVLAAEPNRNNPFQAGFALWDAEHRWVLRFSMLYLKKLFEAAGLRVERTLSGGCIFPNVTPLWLFPLLRRMPYQIPLIGISNWVVASKPNVAESAASRP